MFKPIDFFDTSSFTYKDIFDGVENVWEVLPRIREYIEQQFAQGKVVGNYKDNVFVGEGSIIHDSADIVGPAIIGKNTIISHGAFVRENCLIGDNVNIGHASEVKNSIILNGTAVAHFNYVGDSIIGNNVNISGGAKLANYRLDKKNVTVKNNDTKIDTGLAKFGAVIGDNSSVGVNSVLNPGTLLGKNVIIYPLMSIRGIHNHNEIIK